MDCYYKLRQLFYYKVRHGLLQSARIITNCDSKNVLCYMCNRWTPSDDFPPLLKLLQLFTLPVSSYGQTSGNSSGLDCTSGFIFRTDSMGLQALPTGIQSRVLDMCSSCYYLTHKLNNEGPHCRVLQSCNPDPKFRVIPQLRGLFSACTLTRTHTFNPESCPILL